VLARLRNIISKASGRLPANLAIRLDKAPLCTFTFDDCPRSALENGGRILEQQGLAGTFFVAGASLNDSADQHGEMLSREDLRGLVRRGHELGCHTYSHESLRTRPITELRLDLDRNRELLLGASGAEGLASFAYPFGETSWAAKAEIATRFAAARGVRPGINGRILDLAELRAVRIYVHEFSEERIRALIQRTVRTRGWLIFYTHEVGDTPSSIGCTGQQFTRVVELVRGSRIEVLPMRSAIGRMMHRA
jgi:peptidoglycan/xylan/chitin deacetylase (PgdA/CDA1 family)